MNSTVRQFARALLSWLTCAFEAAPTLVLVAVFFVVGMSGTLAVRTAHAQSYGGAIATTHHVVGGTPVSGDVVSLDPSTGIFYLAHTVADKNAFGVVVYNPTLLLSDSTGGTPVATTGQVLVNVSADNGPIKTGDLLTTSPTPGVAERAGSTTPYVIGTALSAFPAAAQLSASSSAATGTVQLLLSIGPNNASRATSTPTVASQQPTAGGVGSAVLFRFVKYVLAALVAAGTIYVAFRTSNAAMSSSIISIGRNPLARRSIRSILAADAAVIVLISIIGIAMALALVFVPV
ncbi:MAG: hypothetical protein B7X04_04070 [Parcubacteria group bacterium 21-54-25]|nr:MAG: hypothetical protein B7X04_04070 [Parcubacteria group bacterium 21-54-25]HQU08244.1 hypothetical protein [Candidatus Paceibacterota bacterium]